MTEFFLIVAVAIGIVLQGLRKIPADPYAYALLTFLERPCARVLKPGWRIFPLCPFLFGYILIDMTKKNSSSKDIPPQLLRAPDRPELEFRLELTFVPDESRLLEYIKSGKKEGIWEILDGIVKEKLRQFVTSPIEGPQTGEKMLEAGDDCVAVLLKAIAGEELSQIPSEIPTIVLLHYFQVPRPSPLPEEIKIAGENWEKLEQYMAQLPDARREEIKRAIEERRQVIKNIKNGNGKQSISHLGIFITRLNMAEILPRGEFAKALELKAKEEQERRGEEYETQTEVIKAQQLKKAIEESGEKIELAEAFQVILSWKATREGHGFAFPGSQNPPILDLATKWLAEKLRENKKEGDTDDGRNKG